MRERDSIVRAFSRLWILHPHVDQGSTRQDIKGLLR